MSIFGRILESITGHARATQPAATPGTEGSAPPASATHDDAPQPGQAAAMGEVDVAAVLNGLAAKAPQRLDWQHSIVDLMKLLGLDSSLEARRELAQELHYDGDAGDSARMNVWLHRQVMQKLAQNGGRVPEELRR
ncbi:DUF3597 domain-containing protein [Paracraurococcus ruber]|uniref:DUF3597 domain-containing protein n=1 Tax=Paracraurococcus ruber TaxID=77675 RepID=A0ABS1CYN8_9PROT|nr:DUF3597 domain-containing protein [Paracraurococcus ruber]MBK1659651.1 hypothetical protein [Paracraurococcus ruber]TDG30674.1 DUF3597 domain-containing protein [Paracraurococcus ruber]